MFKLLIACDPHNCDVSPETRKDDYPLAILNKQRFMFRYAEEKGFNAVVFAGDLFHRKRPNYNSHRLVSELLEMYLDWKVRTGGRIFSVVGNHDFYFTLENLEKQPIHVLVQAGALEILDGTPILFEDAGVELNGMPYNEEAYDDVAAYSLREADPDSLKIHIFHQTLLPDGQSFFGGFTNFNQIQDISAKIIACGHFHPGYDPPVQEAFGKYWINPGAISRGTAEDHNLKREPSFVGVAIDEGEVKGWKVVPIPCQLAEEVFSVDNIEAAKSQRREVEEFVASVSNSIRTDVEVSTVEGLKAALSELSDDADVILRAKKYIDDAAEDLNL